VSIALKKVGFTICPLTSPAFWREEVFNFSPTQVKAQAQATQAQAHKCKL